MKKIFPVLTFLLLISSTLIAQTVDPVRNFAKVTVKKGYDSTATTIILNAGDGALLPSPSTEGAFNMIWWCSSLYSDPISDTSTIEWREIVRVTARSGDTLTITRGQDGTRKSNHYRPNKVYKMAISWMKYQIDQIRNSLSSSRAGDTTFNMGVSGQEILRDSARFTPGTGIGITQTGHNIIIENTGLVNPDRTVPPYPNDPDMTLKGDSSWGYPVQMSGTAIEETLNNANRTMTKVWSFQDTAKFVGSIYVDGGTNKVLYTDANGIVKGLSIPATVKVLGSASNIPLYYTIVGAGGASVSASNDTIYITASGGGEAGTISAIQSTDGSLMVTDPTGATTTINISAGGVDSAKLGANSVTSSKILDHSINSIDVAVTFRAPYSDIATYADSSGKTGPHNHGTSNITSGSPFTVPYGGTGVNTIPANQVMIGNGVSPITTVAGGVSGYIFRFNGTTWVSGLADSNSVSVLNTANIRDHSITSTKILNSTILNEDINAAAAIAHSKLASLSTGQLIVGNAGTPTATTLGGDATIGSTGVLTLSPGVVTSLKILDGTIARGDVGSTFKAPYADTADYALASPLSGSAGGDLTGTYPNPTIGNEKVTRIKIDPLLLMGVNGLPDYLCYFVTPDSITIVPGVTISRFDSASLDPYVRRGEAHDLSKGNGTMPTGSLPILFSSSETVTNPTLTRDIYGRITAAISGSPVTGGGGIEYTGKSNFTGSNTLDTLDILGILSYYSAFAWYLPAANNTLPVAGDVMSAYPGTNKLYLQRTAGTTSGAAYGYIVKAESLAPPTGLNAIAINDDSVYCSWTAPVNNYAATAATDSFVLTYSLAGFVYDPTSITENTASSGKYALANSTYAYGINGLTQETNYSFQIFAKTVDPVYSSTGAWCQDTVSTTAGGAPAFSPYDVPGLVADYNPALLTPGDSIQYLEDATGNGNYLRTGLPYRPLAATANGFTCLKFQRVWDSSGTVLRDTTYLADTNRVSAIMHGSDPNKKVTVFMVAKLTNQDTATTGANATFYTAEQTLFAFGNATSYDDYKLMYRKDRDETSDHGLGIYRRSTAGTIPGDSMKYQTKYYPISDSILTMDSLNIFETHMRMDSMMIFFNNDTARVKGWTNNVSATYGLTDRYAQNSDRFIVGSNFGRVGDGALNVPGKSNSAATFYVARIFIYNTEPSVTNCKLIRKWIDDNYVTPYVYVP